MMRLLIQDLRLAVRLSLKSKTFTAVTLLALALGVGANTVIFSAFNAVMSRPLPYNESERIVTVWDSFPKLGVKKIGVAYANFVDLKERARSFDPLALYTAGSTTGFNLTGLGGPERVTFSGDTLRSRGEFTINRDDYGIKARSAFHGLVRVGDRIKFTFDIVARRI